MVVGSRRTVGRHHLLGLHGFIQLADAAAQGVAAHDVAVGQPLGAEVRQELCFVLACQGKQLVQRYGVHAGLRDIEACAHFIFIRPFFHCKRLDVHSVFSFSCKKVKASMTKSYPANAGIPTIRSWMPLTPQPVPREALQYSAWFAL